MDGGRAPIDRLETELADLDRRGLRRTLRALPHAGGRITTDGRTLLNFSSNDYLDLAAHPEVKAASLRAVEELGCGAGASRLMSGHLELHEAVEHGIALLTGTESALVFGSGFLTNLGVLTALAGRNDAVFADRLNHASLIDGMQLSGAVWHRYRHNDLSHLDSLLRKHTAPGRRIIVSDSVFSMDGDIAPVAELAELARRHDAILIIDEAHAVGVMGPDGGGVCTALGVKPDVVVATLSKALGGYGGFAACSETVRDYLVNRARSFIYSTGLPPACLGSALGALAVLRDNPDLGERLLAKARKFHGLLTDAGLEMPPCKSQILPVHIGENQQAANVAETLWEQGIIATAVRPPTVPKGTARLRLSVTLAHTDADLERAAHCVAGAARKEGVC